MQGFGRASTPLTPARASAACAILAAGAFALAGCLAAPGRSGDGDPRTGAVPACASGSAIDFACHRRRYEAMVSREGPRAALADLVVRRARSGYVRAACHQLMHVIGRGAGRLRGIAALDEGDPRCSSGYYHGVVEAVAAAIGAGPIRREAAGVCAPYRAAEPRSLAHYNCAHGMGHGFMEVYDSDLFRSLHGCRALPSGWEQEHCEGGVFMENLTAMSNPDRPSRSLRREEPLYPCTAVARRYKASCYVKQTAYPLYLTNGDFGATFELCEATPDVAFRPACYQGIGGTAVIRANKYVNRAADRLRTIGALCGLGRTRAARRNCVVGAATVVVKDAATRTTDLDALCASFRGRELRAACARTAAAREREFSGGAATSGGRLLRRPGVCHLDAARASGSAQRSDRPRAKA